MLVYSSISAAATPTKSPLSSIMPAGASIRVDCMGTRYCSTKSSLLLTNMRIATAGPLKNTQAGNLQPSFSVKARIETKPTLSPNISTPSISILLTLVPAYSESNFSTQSRNFLHDSTFARITSLMCGNENTGNAPTFRATSKALIIKRYNYSRRISQLRENRRVNLRSFVWRHNQQLIKIFMIMLASAENNLVALQAYEKIIQFAKIQIEEGEYLSGKSILDNTLRQLERHCKCVQLDEKRNSLIFTAKEILQKLHEQRQLRLEKKRSMGVEESLAVNTE